jgi:stage II sporulation protein D
MAVRGTGSPRTPLTIWEIGDEDGILKKRAAFRAIRLLGAALLLWTAACAHRPPAVQAPVQPERRLLRVRVDGHVEALPVEEYVAGCVAAELGSINAAPPAAAIARDVQAILCRSFALASPARHRDEGFDLCATTHCQMYRPVPATVIGRLSREAAERTSGRVLRVDGRPVPPLYHADCGGRTSGADDVWGGAPVPYLRSVKDDACPRRPPWRFEVGLDRLGEALRAAGILEVRALKDVEIERADAAGRAVLVRLAGQPSQVVRGIDFRSAVIAAFGASSLKSTMFTVTRQGRLLAFEGRGNGHGVGLCQAGLIARAVRGDAPLSILGHYFPGAVVEAR